MTQKYNNMEVDESTMLRWEGLGWKTLLSGSGGYGKSDQYSSEFEMQLVLIKLES